MTQTKAVTTIFDYQSSQVRVIMRDGDPWFVAKDVCDVLGLSDVSQAVNGKPSRGEEGLDEDEKDTCIVRTPGGNQTMLCVSESGLYRLIFKSRKAEAKAFRRWVTHEVLPAIRKTGTYVIGQQAPTHTLKERLRDRLLANVQNIPDDCFTIGSVALRHFLVLMDLLAGLDVAAMPEQSIAQRFARYATEVLHIPDEHRRRYTHMLTNGRVVQAWADDLRYLTTFEKWLWGIYFPQHFPDYERYRARRIDLPAARTGRQLPAHTQRCQVVQQRLSWE